MSPLCGIFYREMEAFFANLCLKLIKPTKQSIERETFKQQALSQIFTKLLFFNRVEAYIFGSRHH